MWNVQSRDASHGVPHAVNAECENVGYHRDKQNELPKLLTTPCAFQISSTEPEHARTDRQAKDVVLYQRRGQEGPGKLDAMRHNAGKVMYCQPPVREVGGAVLGDIGDWGGVGHAGGPSMEAYGGIGR